MYKIYSYRRSLTLIVRPAHGAACCEVALYVEAVTHQCTLAAESFAEALPERCFPGSGPNDMIDGQPRSEVVG